MDWWVSSIILVDQYSNFIPPSHPLYELVYQYHRPILLKNVILLTVLSFVEGLTHCELSLGMSVSVFSKSTLSLSWFLCLLINISFFETRNDHFLWNFSALFLEKRTPFERYKLVWLNNNINVFWIQKLAAVGWFLSQRLVVQWISGLSDEDSKKGGLPGTLQRTATHLGQNGTVIVLCIWILNTISRNVKFGGIEQSKSDPFKFHQKGNYIIP